MDKKPRLVLLVEDELPIRRPLVIFLQRHGFSVEVAETAEEGLKALKKHTFIAAVVDLRLREGSSGRDVVVAAPPDMPVLIFSGVPSESAELERIRPLTRLITKPYSPSLLVETLTDMLNESGQAPKEYSDPAPKG